MDESTVETAFGPSSIRPRTILTPRKGCGGEPSDNPCLRLPTFGGPHAPFVLASVQVPAVSWSRLGEGGFDKKKTGRREGSGNLGIRQGLFSNRLDIHQSANANSLRFNSIRHRLGSPCFSA